MAKTREIRKRIKAVANIRRITKTMQMIATSKFARAQQRATASKPYAEALFQLVSELGAAAGEISHPLLAKPKSAEAKDLTLVVTSDRGLCGPYNSSILRVFFAFAKENPRIRQGVIELVGKKGAAALKFNNVNVSASHSIGDKPTFEQIASLADGFIRRYIAGEISSVRVAYMRFISAGKQAPTVVQLLPFDPGSIPGAKKAEGGAAAQYEFSPDAAELLNELLPAAIRSTLFQAFNEAIVSEHVARMVAMKSATDNAGKMGKNLNRKYNRARQTQITTELMEVISGAAALG